MKTQDQKRKEAEERAALRSARSPMEQIELLVKRGAKAQKEINRLTAKAKAVVEQKKEEPKDSAPKERGKPNLMKKRKEKEGYRHNNG